MEDFEEGSWLFSLFCYTPMLMKSIYYRYHSSTLFLFYVGIIIIDTYPYTPTVLFYTSTYCFISYFYYDAPTIIYIFPFSLFFLIFIFDCISIFFFLLLFFIFFPSFNNFFLWFQGIVIFYFRLPKGTPVVKGTHWFRFIWLNLIWFDLTWLFDLIWLDWISFSINFCHWQFFFSCSFSLHLIYCFDTTLHLILFNFTSFLVVHACVRSLFLPESLSSHLQKLM